MPRSYPLPPAVTSGPGLELDFDVDTEDALYAVQCPVPWCDARAVAATTLPFGHPTPCGVDGKPFVGMHVARVQFAREGATRQYERRIRRWQRVGMSREDAKRTVDLARFIQEGFDRRVSPKPPTPEDEDESP